MSVAALYVSTDSPCQCQSCSRQTPPLALTSSSLGFLLLTATREINKLMPKEGSAKDKTHIRKDCGSAVQHDSSAQSNGKMTDILPQELLHLMQTYKKKRNAYKPDKQQQPCQRSMASQCTESHETAQPDGLQDTEVGPVSDKGERGSPRGFSLITTNSTSWSGVLFGTTANFAAPSWAWKQLPHGM